jgi:hypothetical protein
MALKNFSQFTPQTVLSATDYVVGYRSTDEIRTDLDSLTDAISGILISKGFTPGGALGTVKRVNYRYTIDAGENLNAVSGTDDYGFYLTYTPGQLDVYRNGVHLVDTQDYLANNSSQVLNLSTMNPGDVIEIVTLSAAGFTIALSGMGSVFTNHYRYTVPVGIVNPGSVNVSGPDDLGNTLQYASPNLNVYLNGSHLVYGLDYTALNGSSITMVDGLSTGDIVDVSVISAYDIGGMATLSTGVFKLRAGPGIILNPANGQGDVTITGNTLALTGGNIVIPVGSTRLYTNIQSAFNSLSGLLLDSTASVTISADPELITENPWKPLYMDHPNGDKIFVEGNISTIESISNPIVSVVTASGGSLSATFTVNPLTLSGGRTVQKNDIISIHSVSGRDAYIANNSYNGTDAAGHIHQFKSDNTTLGDLITIQFPLTGAWCLLGVASADGLAQTYLSVITGRNNFTGTQPVVTLSGNRLRNWPAGSPFTVQFGSPGSVIFNTASQPVRILSAFPVGNCGQHIVFSSGTPGTNTWLNVGDQIITLGQATVVKRVSSTAAIDVTTALKFTSSGTVSGYSSSFGQTPNPGLHFLVKTFWERYRGAFRVQDVTGNNVTISIPDITWKPLTYSGTTYNWEVTPLPVYGIERIGRVAVIDSESGQYNYPIAIHTTRIKTIGTAVTQNNLGRISKMAFDYAYDLSALSGSITNGLNIGYDPQTKISNSVSVVLGNNVAFHNFLYSIYIDGASNLQQTGGSLATGSNTFNSNTSSIVADNGSTFTLDGFGFASTYGIVLQRYSRATASYGVCHAAYQWFSVNRSSLTLSWFSGLETSLDYEYTVSSLIDNTADLTLSNSRFYVRQHVYTGIRVTATSNTNSIFCGFYGNQKEISALPGDQYLIWMDYNSNLSLSYLNVYTGSHRGLFLRFNSMATSERDIMSNNVAAFVADSNSQIISGEGGNLTQILYNGTIFQSFGKCNIVCFEVVNAFNRAVVAINSNGNYVDLRTNKHALRNEIVTSATPGFNSATMNYVNIS